MDMDIRIDSPLSSPMSIISGVSSIDLNNENTIRDNVVQISENPPKTTYRGSDDLRSIEEIDYKYRHIFHYPYFNRIQSKIMDDVLYTDKSIVVSAPTGSGKTVIFEMAIVRFLQQIEKLNYIKDFKIVYMAPMKALCTERLMDWYSKFTKHGLSCIEATGDSDSLDFSQLKSYKIIMTTPEKWDSLTRKWKDNKGVIETIKLFIIDEIHLLNENVRGPVLEAIVSRMKTIQETISPINHKNNEYERQLIGIRFIAASATIPNVQDIADWLSTKQNPAIAYSFGEELRPVKLKKIVEAYPWKPGQGMFKFDLYLNYKIHSIIEKYCDGKPTLIFCNTRKGVMMTAETLSKEILFQFTNGQATKFSSMATRLSEKKLQVLLMSGIGCHHAGLLHSDRILIEQIFREGDLPVLITTSTLAMGVNLPAHLVIIKTTQHYVNGTFVEYEESSILQMIGRAGRPQFDTEGVAVIMTRTQDRERYENLCSGTQPVESKLHKHLAEHLNAEIALGTLTDLLLAMDWLRSTFLYVRAKRNPTYYGCSKLATREHIEKKLQEICVKCVNALARAGLVIMDDDTRMTPTEAGSLMAMHCLDLDTMKLIIKIKGSESLNDLLILVSDCHEFEDVVLRAGEKRHLNQLNRNARNPSCRFPQPGKIQNKHMKANCLIQSVFGCLPILDPSLNQESVKILRIGENIARCIVAYLTRPSMVDKNEPIYKALLNSIVLNKCFIAKMWDNSQFVLRQLNGIGPAYASLLVSAGKTTFASVIQSNPRDIERIINKGPPTGNHLQKQAVCLPVYSITLCVESTKLVSLNLSITNYEDIKVNGSTIGNLHKISLIVGDSENNLLYFTTILDYHLINLQRGTLNRKFHPKLESAHTIYAHCASNSWVGLDVNTSVKIKKSSKNQVPTSPYDIRFYMENHNSDYDANKSNPVLFETERTNKNHDCDIIESSQHADFKPNKRKSVANPKKHILKDQEFERSVKKMKIDENNNQLIENLEINMETEEIEMHDNREMSDEQTCSLFYNDNHNDIPSNIHFNSKEWIDSYESWKKKLRLKRDEICKSSPFNKKTAHCSKKTICNKQSKNERLKSLDKTPPLTSYWQKVKTIDCSSIKCHDDNKYLKSNSFEYMLNNEFLNPFNEKDDLTKNNFTSDNILKTSSSSLALNNENIFASKLHSDKKYFTSNNILNTDSPLILNKKNIHKKIDSTIVDENDEIMVTDRKKDDFEEIGDYINNTSSVLNSENAHKKFVSTFYNDKNSFTYRNILNTHNSLIFNKENIHKRIDSTIVDENEEIMVTDRKKDDFEEIGDYINNTSSVLKSENIHKKFDSTFYNDKNSFTFRNILNTDNSLILNKENTHKKIDSTIVDENIYENEEIVVTDGGEDDFQDIVDYINNTKDSNDEMSQDNPNEEQNLYRDNSEHIDSKILEDEDDLYCEKNTENYSIDENMNNFTNNAKNVNINEDDHGDINQINNKTVELNNIIQILEKTEDEYNAKSSQKFSEIQNNINASTNDIIFENKHNSDIIEPETNQVCIEIDSVFPHSNDHSITPHNLIETHENNETGKEMVLYKGRYANPPFKCENSLSSLLKNKKMHVNYFIIESEEYKNIPLHFYIKSNSIFFNHLKQFISYDINRSLTVSKNKEKSIGKIKSKPNMDLKTSGVEIKKSTSNQFEVTAKIDKTQNKDKETKQSEHLLINKTEASVIENTSSIEKSVNTSNGALKVSIIFKTPNTEKYYENKKKTLKQSTITTNKIVPKNKKSEILKDSKSSNDSIILPSVKKDTKDTLQMEIAKILQNHALKFKDYYDNPGDGEENAINNVDLIDNTSNQIDNSQENSPRTHSIRDVLFHNDDSILQYYSDDTESPKYKSPVRDYNAYLWNYQSDKDSVSCNSSEENSSAHSSQDFSEQFLLNAHKNFKKSNSPQMYSPDQYDLYNNLSNRYSEIHDKKRRLNQNIYYNTNNMPLQYSMQNGYYPQNRLIGSPLQSTYTDSFDITPERYKIFELDVQTQNMFDSKHFKNKSLKVEDLKQFEMTPKKRMY